MDIAHRAASTSSGSCQVVSTAAALHAYAAEIRDAELARALARLDDLSAADAVVVQALAERIVGRLLDRPVTLLKADAEGAKMAHVLRKLFRLEPEAERPARRAGESPTTVAQQR